MREWGKEFNDKRDWKEYNEQLVVRGEFYLDLDFRNGWNDELVNVNMSKRGGQFLFPDSFVKWLTVWKQLVDYRGLEGISRKLHQLGLIPRYPDYTTIWHRIRSSTPEISLPAPYSAEIATDGSGLKTRNAGEYRITKYGDPDAKQKKHLVVVITADVRRKKLLCVEVHIEGKGHTEASIAAEHISSLSKKGLIIKKFYGDGAFDQYPLFNELHSIGAKPIIKIRKNASTDHNYTGGKFRLREVREYKEMGYERWSSLNQYGMRWPGTEGIFSAVQKEVRRELRIKVNGRTHSRRLSKILGIR